MTKKILTILAPGFEEIEAITPIDIFRRAEFEVTLASLDDEKKVHGRNKICIETSTTLDKAKESDFDVLFLPGGPGAKKLRNDERVLELVKDFNDKNLLIAAICAAPTVLLDAGILAGKKYTAHFSTQEELPNIQKEPVVVDKNIITSQGPGTALPFALKIVEVLSGKEIAKKIAENICSSYN